MNPGIRNITCLIVAFFLLSACDGVIASPTVTKIETTATEAATVTVSAAIPSTHLPPNLTSTITPIPTPTPSQENANTKFLAGRIAFISERDGYPALYVMNADGSELTRLVDADISAVAGLAWSPNGEKLLVQGKLTGGLSSFTVWADGSHQQDLPVGAQLPWGKRWSLQAGYFVTALGAGLALSDSDGELLQTVDLKAFGWLGTRISDPVPSPKGDQIAFLSYSEDDASDLVVLDRKAPDQMFLRDLTQVVSETHHITCPTWSPDGSSIVYLSISGDDQDMERSLMQISYNYPESRTVLVRGVAAACPSWSPGGRFLTYTSEDDGNQDIYVINVIDSKRTRLTDTSAADYAPVWGHLGDSVLSELADMKIRAERDVSPSGDWMAEVITLWPSDVSQMQGQYYRILKITSQMDAEWWSQGELVDMNVGSPGLAFLGWSRDERWLYLADRLLIQCEYPHLDNVRRVDLQGGSFQQITESNWDPQFTSLAPDRNTLVVIEQNLIRLIDLETSSERQIPFLIDETSSADSRRWGNVVWSPDGKAFAFSVIWLPCSASHEQAPTSVFRVDIPSATVTTLLEWDWSNLLTQAWYPDGRIWLHSPQGRFSWLDAASGEKLDAEDEEIAEGVLREFLDALRGMRYFQAVDLYGGSYKHMVEQNPDLNPDDYDFYFSLLKNACTINGSVCHLPPYSFTLEDRSSETEFIFIVEFSNPDGTLFELGEILPISQFKFLVQKTDDGDYQVMTMPPYLLSAIIDESTIPR